MERALGDHTRRVWRRPTRLRSAEPNTEDRHATWFELFFDLVFALAVSQLSSVLLTNPSPLGFVQFAALFVPVWWAWVIYVTYADRFDTDDVVYRGLVMLGMLAVVAMAVSLPRALSENEAAPFAIAYVVVRLVPLVLYAHAGLSLPLGKEIAWGYGTATLPAAGLWLGGLFVQTPIRFVLWTLAATIEIGNPFVRRGTIQRTPVAVSHFAERFGAFTIIVLGESVLSVGTTLGSTTWRTLPALVAASAFIVTAAQWWLYFDFMDGRPLSGGFLTRHIFVYGHLPIVVGITAIAAGSRLSITEVSAGNASLDSGAVWALCGGAALFELATACIHAARHSFRDWLVLGRAATAVGLVTLGALGPRVSPLELIGLIAGVHVVQVVAELTWHGSGA